MARTGPAPRSCSRRRAAHERVGHGALLGLTEQPGHNVRTSRGASGTE